MVAVEVDAVQLVGEAYRCPQERRIGCGTLDSPHGEFSQPLLGWNCGFASKGAGNSQVEKSMMDGLLFNLEKKGEHMFFFSSV